MYKFLFRTRYGALGFVAFILIGVTSLVGTDSEGGLIQYGVNNVTGQEGTIGEDVSRLHEMQDMPQPTGSSEISGPSEIDEVSQDHGPRENEGYKEGSWASDNDLIDEATGVDPTPIVATDYNPEQGEIIETFVEEEEIGELRVEEDQ